MRVVPHNVALGLRLVEVGDGSATMLLPYKKELVGNPETGVIFGGAITAMTDACCGAAVFTKLKNPSAIATLDLRIDYLKPATPERDIIAVATCYKATRNAAFVRCVAYHDPDDPIAHVAATFMLGTK